jgi:hypothetical protein
MLCATASVIAAAQRSQSTDTDNYDCVVCARHPQCAGGGAWNHALYFKVGGRLRTAAQAAATWRCCMTNITDAAAALPSLLCQLSCAAAPDHTLPQLTQACHVTALPDGF